jgi:hypothetical protein
LATTDCDIICEGVPGIGDITDVGACRGVEVPNDDVPGLLCIALGPTSKQKLR